MFASLFGIAAVGMLTINLDFKRPAENLLSDVSTLLKNIELDILLVVAFVSGKTTCANCGRQAEINGFIYL